MLNTLACTKIITRWKETNLRPTSTITESMDTNLNKLQERLKDREVCGVAKSRTQLSDPTTAENGGWKMLREIRNLFETLSHVWQKPLQYCKVISLQLIKINQKKTINCKKKKERYPILFGFHSFCSLMHAKSLQSCPTLCNPWIVALKTPLTMVVQEGVATHFSRGSSWPWSPPSVDGFFTISTTWKILIINILVQYYLQTKTY